MNPTHGGLFEGYGGTTMAARAALRALGMGELDTRWVSDTKPASIALLAHRHPDVPNLGNMKLINYQRVEPVDVLTASWPCQPHSSAGLRLGEADPRALWPYVARAVADIRPAIFLGENVARITSNGELRRVVRSLAALGYVGAWRVLRASDPPVYGCHQRARCFVVAVDASALDGVLGLGSVGSHVAPAARGERNGVAALTLLPTPTQSMTTGAGTSGRDGGLNLQTAVALLPTPKASDGYHGGPNMRGSSGDLALPAVAMSLLPTPTVNDSRGGRNATAGRSDPDSRHHDGWTLSDVAHATRWGAYAEAIARWGCAFDREAPAPTQVGPRGGFQLAPGFVEWMMGLPQGWVCDVPDLAPRANGHRNAALSLLGDGVVPQQGAAAFTFLLGHLAQRLAVAA